MDVQKYENLLEKRDGAYHLIKELEGDFLPEQVVTPSEFQKLWQHLGCRLAFEKNRYFEAIEVFLALYQKMLVWQSISGKWTHKAMPLVWISDCFRAIGFPSLAKRYMMLTLVDDAIRDFQIKGELLIDEGGTYFRLRYFFGMGHEEILSYSKLANDIFQQENALKLYPEYILQKIDNEWIVETPSFRELSYYLINPIYIDALQKGLGSSTGINLELLASYLMSAMPGCRTYMRVSQVGNSTDYDIVGSVDGPITDYRSELGRYFICECKDWNSPADFTTMAKFCRILSSTKIKLGILFSKEGVTGARRNIAAEREQRKVFQDSNIIIVVIDNEDIESIKRGKNLIGLLRSKYEAIILDLPF